MGIKFPEYRVRLERVPPGESAIAVPYPDNHGLCTKLGGEPYWIQPGVSPFCEGCQQSMAFVAQIDSIDYTGYPRDDVFYMFGDMGMLYIFYCVGCGDAAVVRQSH